VRAANQLPPVWPEPAEPEDVPGPVLLSAVQPVRVKR